MPWRLVLGVLCMLLVIFVGTLSVSHVHPDGPESHADCGLCATAHGVVTLVQAPVPVSVAQVFERIVPAMPEARSRGLRSFALFTRPPPADAHLS